MTEQELLSQLKDIAEPAPVSWWPPAPGWWLLAILILALLIGLCVWLVARWRNNRFRKLALQELSSIRLRYQEQPAPLAHLNDLNTLLKRVAITRYGRERVSALHGESWCRFLSEQAPGLDFLDGPGRLLGDGHYRPAAELPLDSLQQLAQDWIRRCK